MRTLLQFDNQAGKYIAESAAWCKRVWVWLERWVICSTFGIQDRFPWINFGCANVCYVRAAAVQVSVLVTLVLKIQTHLFGNAGEKMDELGPKRPVSKSSPGGPPTPLSRARRVSNSGWRGLSSASVANLQRRGSLDAKNFTKMSRLK